MICIFRQKKYGAHFCLRYVGATHCGILRALVCAVGNALKIGRGGTAGSRVYRRATR